MSSKCRKCRFRDPKFKIFHPTNVSSLFNNVTYFVTPPKKNPNGTTD